jgi:hypothetical protein
MSKLIFKVIIAIVLKIVIKDWIAGNQIAQSILKRIPDDEKGIVRACKRLGMSDIQTVTTMTIISEEIEKEEKIKLNNYSNKIFEEQQND